MTPLLVALAVSVLQCPVCDEAGRLVEDGDTAAAVSALREAVEDLEEERLEPPPEMAGLLGELLVATGAARTVEFEDRAEAEEMLRLAIAGDENNPRWWYAMGLLERKRGLKLDADRFLDRALELAEAHPEALTVRERSRIYVEKARAQEEHVMDFQGFVAQDSDIPIVQGGDEACAVAFCLNFERPDWFHEILFAYETQEQLVAEDRERMRELFQRGFHVDPSHGMAARGWLGELARSHEWEQYVEVAREHAEAAPDSAWPLVFLGAGLHRLGQQGSATNVFETALERLPEEERDLLQGVGPIVRRREAEALSEAEPEARRNAERFTWSRLDPFYLTEPNERRLEHLTRVALAELWWGEPRLRERGARTDPGIIFIRYGEPRWVRQIRISDAAAGAIQELTGGKPAVGGRWMLWTYSKNTPSYVFQKQLGGRRIQHASSTGSRELEEFMRDRQPSSYQPPGYRTLRHQVARFRGTEADVEADVILEVPEAEDDRESVPGQAGIFILPTAPGREAVGLRTRVDLAAGEGGSRATFRVPVNRGSYPYSAEVLAQDRSVAGSVRGVLDVSEFGADDDLHLSDLLVADSIRPVRDEPTERRHFRIAGSPDLSFGPGEAVGVYFEIYGLEEDDGASRYRVEVRIEGEDEGFLGGIARRISEILGDMEEGGRVRWQGTAEAGSDRVPEWFTLSLPELEPGSYTLEVRVRDEVADREASQSRTVEFVENGGGS